MIPLVTGKGMPTVRLHISGFEGRPPTSEQSKAIQSEKDQIPCVRAAIGFHNKALGPMLLWNGVQL